MEAFSVYNCIVFIIPFQINSQELEIRPYLYFIKDGVNVNTTNFQEIYNTEFDKVVIDLMLTHYLESVALIYSS